MSDLEDFARFYLYVLARKPSTTQKYIERLKAWESLTEMRSTDIGPEDVIDYLTYTTHMGNTKKGMLLAIKGFRRWEVATGRKKVDDLAAIDSPSVRDQDCPAPLESRYVVPLLDACRTPLEYRTIWLPLYAGTRIGESAAFHGERWGQGDKILWIKGMKTDKVRPVPLHPDLETVMWHILASRPTATSTLQKVRRRISERTGIHFRTHQLRKRFAQELADTGADKGTRGDFLGHGTVTDLYNLPNVERMRNDLLRVDYRGKELSRAA